MKRADLTVGQYVDGVVGGDRAVLARAITLIESNAPAHEVLAQAVLTELLPRRLAAVRVGVTGVPGAGKSTLIEALGTRLTAAGHRVAVTAIDPSSTLTGGSILGDKTRMEKLAGDPAAFIRPSPSGGTLGGVARKTRETIVLFEAAGYDVIIVETVGVGQSESQVRAMVDFFLLVLLAGAGDELQGFKRGVIELADAVAINKADGPSAAAAELCRAGFAGVLPYLRSATEGWRTRAHACSALTGYGLQELWGVVEAFERLTRAGGAWDRRRGEQERAWVRELVREGLEGRFRSHAAVVASLATLEDEVVAGRLPATVAAKKLLDLFAGSAGTAG